MKPWSWCLIAIFTAASPGCAYVAQQQIVDDLDALSGCFDRLVKVYNACKSTNIHANLDDRFFDYIDQLADMQNTVQSVWMRGDHKNLRSVYSRFHSESEAFVGQTDYLIQSLLTEASVSRRRQLLSELGNVLENQRARHLELVDRVNEHRHVRF